MRGHYLNLSLIPLLWDYFCKAFTCNLNKTPWDPSHAAQVDAVVSSLSVMSPPPEPRRHQIGGGTLHRKGQV